MDKKVLRQTLLQQRKELSDRDWTEKSKAICENIAQTECFRKAKTVLAYFSVRQEPDLSYLWTLDAASKCWGLSRCVGKTLVWHQYNPHLPKQVQPGAYGILEPLPTLPLVKPDSVDLILVPAVACDRRGFRLGYGGGFYDRLLAQPEWADKPTIGIVFEFALLNQLDADPWDRPMRSVCTENGFMAIDLD
ncbi:MAG: 5-formyltetrahydrofolate cyclo-ligase [Acaryochloridaceae cyanobacterium RU_4_10]|nr:5-formyltetrahydrofolate cyclo-ligase [Acaryochloridaceae cyanobacterium RU_4_10]